MANNYDFPVYRTQGGGLVKEVDGKLVWVETPTSSAFARMKIGDEMPEEWDIAPGNELARKELIQDDIPDSLDAEMEEALQGFANGE